MAVLLGDELRHFFCEDLRYVLYVLDFHEVEGDAEDPYLCCNLVLLTLVRLACLLFVPDLKARDVTVVVIFIEQAFKLDLLCCDAELLLVVVQRFEVLREGGMLKREHELIVLFVVGCLCFECVAYTLEVLSSPLYILVQALVTFQFRLVYWKSFDKLTVEYRE